MKDYLGKKIELVGKYWGDRGTIACKKKKKKTLEVGPVLPHFTKRKKKPVKYVWEEDEKVGQKLDGSN